MATPHESPRILAPSNSIQYERIIENLTRQHEKEIKIRDIEIMNMNLDITVKNTTIVDMKLDHTSLLANIYGLGETIEDQTAQIECITADITQNEDDYFEYRDDTII